MPRNACGTRRSSSRRSEAETPSAVRAQRTTAGSVLRSVVTEGPNPFLNMALDDAVAPDPPVLRLYSFSPPALSLGYFQKASDFAARDVERLGAVVVRRVTGGGAILHRDDLTFSLVARPDHPVFEGAIE